MTLFSLVSVLVSLAAVSSYVNYRYIKLPTTIGVMLMALVASLALILAGRAFAMTDKTREHVDTFWELVDDILNVVLFLLVGLELLVLPIQRSWLLAGVLTIPIVLSARWLTVAGIIGPLRWIREQSRGAIAVLSWGGLRGAISVALALSLPANDSRSLILTLTYFVVVFSILVQGLTAGRVIRRVCNPKAPKSTSGP
jgi:CPA1 family monovalent cation:H+ antiporter